MKWTNLINVGKRIICVNADGDTFDVKVFTKSAFNPLG